MDKPKDYSHLDKYEDHFDREVTHHDKVFDHPLGNNDPLSLVESSVENSIPLGDKLSSLESSIEGSVGSPRGFGEARGFSPHPPLQNERMPWHGTPDAPRPDVLEGEHHRYWREPIFQPKGKSGVPRGKHRKTFLPDKSALKTYLGSKPSSKKTGLTYCPKDDGFVLRSQCKACDMHIKNSTLNDNCKMKLAESKRLSRKKK